jgi:error-prone DNA polymerase
VRDAAEHGVAILPVDVNRSGWDNAIEAGAADREVHPRWTWGAAEYRKDNGFGLRLGFRQIDGFREDWGLAIATERLAHGPFTSIEELGRRARIPVPDSEATTALPTRALRLLADADACGSLDLGRRQAAWEVRRMPGATELPLFAAARARELAEEPDAQLPVMPLSEEVTADYQTIRLSLKQHPMHFLRETLRGQRILSSEKMLAVPNGKRAKVAGVVLVRQRPGKGNAIFATLEDETGIVNILLWARLFERYHRPLMASRLMEAHGVVQKSKEGVIHLMADRIIDRTDLLDQLSDEGPPPVTLSRADVVAHPQVPRGRHPRDVRVIPKSRDFH